MTQLVSPSDALNQAFVLPKVSAEANPSRPAAQATVSIIAGYGVTVGNLGLLLPNGVASRLVEVEDIRLCRLPTAPGWLLGMANLDGNTVPMFDLEQVLELPRGAPPTHYLVIGEGEQAAGVTLAERPQRARLGPQDKLNRNPPLPAALQAHVRACYRTDRVWVDWDYIGFFEAMGAQL